MSIILELIRAHPFLTYLNIGILIIAFSILIRSNITKTNILKKINDHICDRIIYENVSPISVGISLFVCFLIWPLFIFLLFFHFTPKTK